MPPSSLSENPPREKKSCPSASTFESSRTSSPGTGSPGTRVGGSQSSWEETAVRHRMAYWLPSTVRE